MPFEQVIFYSRLDFSAQGCSEAALVEHFSKAKPMKMIFCHKENICTCSRIYFAIIIFISLVKYSSSGVVGLHRRRSDRRAS